MFSKLFQFCFNHFICVLSLHLTHDFTFFKEVINIWIAALTRWELFMLSRVLGMSNCSEEWRGRHPISMGVRYVVLAQYFLADCLFLEDVWVEAWKEHTVSFRLWNADQILVGHELFVLRIIALLCWLCNRWFVVPAYLDLIACSLNLDVALGGLHILKVANALGKETSLVFRWMVLRQAYPLTDASIISLEKLWHFLAVQWWVSSPLTSISDDNLTNPLLSANNDFDIIAHRLQTVISLRWPRTHPRINLLWIP